MTPLIWTWYHLVWVCVVTVATTSGSDPHLVDMLDRFKSIFNSQTITDKTVDALYDLLRTINEIEGEPIPTALPESKMTTVELITNMGYKAEAHNVTTEDGYTIEIHRILPFGQTNDSCQANRFPVLLQHGLFESSSIWVLNFPNQSLGFLLASAGFDVWLSNIRGSRYGKIQKEQKPYYKKFWNFGLDELSTYDLSSMIDYVLQATNSTQLQYVGHSMGTTMAFMLLSTKPQYNDKILLSLMKIYALPPTDTYTPAVDIVCRPDGSLCMEALDDFYGSDPQQLNNTRFSVYIHQILEMMSIRTLLHYAQIEQTQLFLHYDWGLIRNQYAYRQFSPPPYPLENITTPTVLYVGGNDNLATLENVRLLIPRLPHNKVSIVANDLFWNHMDPVWGVSAGPIVLNDVVQRLCSDSINS